MPCELRQSRGKMIWFETKWAGFGLESNEAVSIDQVNAIRPAGIDALGGVSKFIEDSRELDPQFADAGSCDESAFFFILRAGKDHLVFDIALHLPHVAGVRLGDIHH